LSENSFQEINTNVPFVWIGYGKPQSAFDHEEMHVTAERSFETESFNFLTSSLKEMLLSFDINLPQSLVP